MTILAQQLERIAAAPAGAQVAAFFDYDGTVIDGYSVADIYRDRLRRADIGLAELGGMARSMLTGVTSENDFASVLDATRPFIAGKTEAELIEFTTEVFARDTAAKVRPEICRLIAAHRRRGHTIVIASSATRFQVAPVAAELGIDHVLATELQTRDGVLTGEVAGRPLWGPGKAAAVREFARRESIDLSASFAYSDGNEDRPFLEAVGEPTAVNPGARLAHHAARRSWPTLEFSSRPQPSPLSAIRTAGFYASFVGGSVVGAAIGAIGGRPSTLTEFGIPAGTDLGLALAGISVEIVSGREYLTQARPCVFVFNHQSKLDAAILVKVLHSGFSAIAKHEVRDVPVLGAILDSAGVVFIDRERSGKAIEQLQPAVAKLRDDGVSLVISPEGTRSATAALGPFRKGPFHIALQAGVPVVPIVIGNAGQLMGRHSQVMSSGTVEVRVLAPIDTSSWEPESIGEHAADVRARFVDALTDWGAPTSSPDGDRSRSGLEARA